MTYREALRIKDPDLVDDMYTGGCLGCPSDYFDDSSHCLGAGNGGCSEENCRKCWDREIPQKEPETFREKLQQEHPEAIGTDFNGGCRGCPSDYCYESVLDCQKACRGASCTECWDRKLPGKEQAEEPVEIKIEEEKKMRNLVDVIRDAVLNAINDSNIEYAIKECFENHDYSDMIKRAVENYLDENIEDIADDIVEEAVRDYMRDNL